MFSVLAISNSATTALSTVGGNALLIFAARPRPVTRPMLAHMAWIDAISGYASGIIQSMLSPYCAPACE